MREEARKKNKGEGILVHGAMKYRCRDCGYEWWIFLEKGLEDPAYRNTEQHKPVPYAISCGMCQGIAYDVSGYIPLPGSEHYAPLPGGESYFANYSRRDCGYPILAPKDRHDQGFNDAKCPLADREPNAAFKDGEQAGYIRGYEDGYDEACMDLTDDDLGSATEMESE